MPRSTTTGIHIRRRLIQLLFRLRQFSRFDDKTWFVAMVIAVGVLAALVSRGAGLIADLIQSLVLGGSGSYLPLVRGMEPRWMLLLIPALGGLAFGLIVHYLVRQAGDGCEIV